MNYYQPMMCTYTKRLLSVWVIAFFVFAFGGVVSGDATIVFADSATTSEQTQEQEDGEQSQSQTLGDMEQSQDQSFFNNTNDDSDDSEEEDNKNEQDDNNKDKEEEGDDQSQTQTQDQTLDSTSTSTSTQDQSQEQDDEGQSQFQSQDVKEKAQCDNPTPNDDLSGSIGQNGEATVTNDSDVCEYEVGLASYKKFDNIIDNQEIFDFATTTIGTSTTIELSIDVPQCDYQIDLFHGDVLMSLDGQRYSDRLLDWDHPNRDAGFCEVPEDPIHPTATISADPDEVEEGDSTEITWGSEDAVSCESDDFDTDNATSGTITVDNIVNDTTFEVTCESETGHTASDSVTVVVTQKEESQQCENPDPNGDLSGSIGKDGEATVTNDSDVCEYEVGLASYKKFDNIIDNQEIFDFATTTIGTSTTIELSIDVPQCDYQIDLFHGDVLMSLDGQRYSDRLLDWDHPNRDAGFCEVPEDPIHPTATISADPDEVEEGDSTEITWGSEDAVSCESDDFDTDNATSGTITVDNIVNDTTFEVTCESETGHTDSDSVTVTVIDDEIEWCSFEGKVIDHTDHSDAKTHNGSAVNSDRRDVDGVENGPASNVNTAGQEKNYSTDDFFSLGVNGYLVYEFTDSVVFDQAGADIAIYEITGGDEDEQTEEKIEVLVSTDNVTYESLGMYTGDAYVDIDSADLPFVKYIKLVDHTPHNVHGGGGDGYDVDAIIILNGSCGDAVLPSVDLKANGQNGPITIDEGSTTTLSWDVEDADSCVAGGDWSGSKTATSSSENLGELSVGNYSFDLTCANEHGTSSDSVDVTVEEDTNGGDDDKEMTIVASKIVCEDESDLPNWHSGSSIDADTAQTFVDNNPSCEFADDWSFQWGYEGVNELPGDHIGEADGSAGVGTDTGSGSDDWKTFGPTNASGTATVEIEDTKDSSRIWVREVLKDGFVSFSDANSQSGNVSAEMWCHNDVLNYDNYDFISNPQLDKTYYCVSINALIDTATTTLPSVDLKANGQNGPITIDEGSTTTLSWDVEDADSCVAGGDWSGSKTATSSSENLGELSVGNYSFDLTCANEHGTSSDSVDVKVKKDGNGGGGDNKPDVDLKANGSNGPITIDEGSTTTLSWTLDHDPETCVAGGDWSGSKATSSDSESLGLLSVGDYTFDLTCANEHGTSTDSVDVTVEEDNNGGGGNKAPTVDLKANGSNSLTVDEDTEITLDWSIGNNPETCVAGGDWSGSKATSSDSELLGELSEGNYSYTLTCANEHGTSSDSVNVTVEDDNNGGGGGTGGGSIVTGGWIGNGIEPDRRPEGEVLGIQSCSYLEDFLHIDWNNDPVEVAKLQYFLREFEGYNIDVTTVFDQHTYNTVVDFQERYFDEVLAPWDHTGGTGFVYITTKTRINEIVCQEEINFTDAEREEMREFRSYLASIGGDWRGGQGGFGAVSDTNGSVAGVNGVGGDSPAADDQDDNADETGTTSTSSGATDTTNGYLSTVADVLGTGTGTMASFAASALNFPNTTAEAAQCLVNLLLVLAIIFLIGTIIVNAQETEHLSKNTLWARRIMIYILGTIVAGGIAYFTALFCLIVPLLVVLIILAVSLLLVVNKDNGEIENDAVSNGDHGSSSGNGEKKGLRDSVRFHEGHSHSH
ncbi:MAG: hypothetical protein WDZ82_03525 [Candidatus Paceibacterota bacterium]